ncbi:MAG: hypothetical protein H7322_19730 [Ramlibacter sp.]|nr:hypothetical protein [Ramlibacter sp.]
MRASPARTLGAQADPVSVRAHKGQVPPPRRHHNPRGDPLDCSIEEAGDTPVPIDAAAGRQS